MKLILNQDEIHTAIRDYAIKQGLALSGKWIDISLTAGRKENGFTAELEIGDSPIVKVEEPIARELVDVSEMKRAAIGSASKLVVEEEPCSAPLEEENPDNESEPETPPPPTNSLFHPALKAE